jgi:hypothetical protein
MAHVNTGQTSSINVRIDQFRYTKPLCLIPADTNCSLCAAAGAIIHATGRFTTSGDVANDHPPVFPEDHRLASEFEGEAPIYQHNQTFTRHVKLAQSGLEGLGHTRALNELTTEKMATYLTDKTGCKHEIYKGTRKAVMAWMNERVATCFFTYYTEGHWNFARKSGEGALEFVDYQTDRENGPGPTISALPILGLTGGVYEPTETANATVIAFVKNRPQEINARRDTRRVPTWIKETK